MQDVWPRFFPLKLSHIYNFYAAAKLCLNGQVPLELLFVTQRSVITIINIM